MASLLDPCFRTTYIKNEKVDDIKAGAIDEIKSLLPEQQAATTDNSSVLPRAGAAAAAAAEPKKTLAFSGQQQHS